MNTQWAIAAWLNEWIDMSIYPVFRYLSSKYQPWSQWQSYAVLRRRFLEEDIPNWFPNACKKTLKQSIFVSLTPFLQC
jgi:hypothetical protein